MEYFICIAAGYLIGTFNLAYLLGKRNGLDIKKHGTGNAGASNTAIVLGWKAAAMVAISDIGKALLAVGIVSAVYPQLPMLPYLTGLSVVLGHIYPFYLQFKGGKGFASYLGMILALDWRVFIAVVVIGAIITFVTDYIALATLATAIGYPIYLYLSGKNMIVVLLFTFLSLVIMHKHRGNIQRILKGEEIGLRKVKK